MPSFLSIIKLGDEMNKNQLIERMNQIGDSVKKYEHALALLALGSIGTSRDRLDEYSDLDFFLIVEDQAKKHMIDDLSWLERVCPISFRHRNTVDGYKVLFSDGIYAEFAVFGRSEVKYITQAEARLIWKKDDYDEPTLLIEKNTSLYQQKPNLEYLVNEALTNLYVGLNRALRGEKLSALRYIESYAIDNSIKFYLLKHQYKLDDPFSDTRRLEINHPELKPILDKMLQGYSHISQSAKHILDFLKSEVTINPFIEQTLNKLIHDLKEKEETH